MQEGGINEAHPLFITMGSNIHPVKNLYSAINYLKKEFGSVKVSNFYESPAILGPLKKDKQQNYLNAAILTTSNLDPKFIKFNILRMIEKRLKRTRTTDKFAPRTIDLDIALYGTMVIRTHNIIIPDPDILLQSHIIFPLCDLDLNFKHPIAGISLSEIKNSVDQSTIKLLKIDKP